ncbi:MAG: hypothetical protein NT059_11895 [Planctomycetota bacterium]|nr:hypothetical protein [Planctomycetota bacterium]
MNRREDKIYHARAFAIALAATITAGAFAHPPEASDEHQHLDRCSPARHHPETAR